MNVNVRMMWKLQPTLIQMSGQYKVYNTLQLRRNMSLWYIYKDKFKQAWANTIKIDSDTDLKKYGVEIGTANLLVRMGARVQFNNGVWYTKSDLSRRILPVEELRGKTVVAIDAKQTHLDQFSMVNLVRLSHLKYLSVEDCPLVDDACLGSLVNLRESLTHLNLNKCSQVTENGIATLHKLRNLERLNMNDLPNVQNATLVAVMLEDVLPRLRISLVSLQIEKLASQIKEGLDIINEHRKEAGLLEDQNDENESADGMEHHQTGNQRLRNNLDDKTLEHETRPKMSQQR